MNLIFSSVVLFAAATLTASIPNLPGLLGDPFSAGAELFGLHKPAQHGPLGGAGHLPHGLLGQKGPLNFFKAPLGQQKLPLPLNFFGHHGSFPFGGDLGGPGEGASSETVVSTAAQTSSIEGIGSGEGATATAVAASSASSSSS